MEYYAANNERYKTAHAHGVSWASDKSSPIALPDFDSLMYAVVKR